MGTERIYGAQTTSTDGGRHFTRSDEPGRGRMPDAPCRLTEEGPG
jgi:hypothetical protein